MAAPTGTETTRRKGCTGPVALIAIGAALVVLGGLVGGGLAIYGGATAVTGINDILRSVDAGSTATVDLAEGDYFLYLEGDGLFVDSEGFTRAPGVVEPAVTVTGPDGTAVDLGGVDIDVTTSGLGGTDRLAYASFDADTAGEYTIEVSEADPPVDAVAIGPAIDLWGSLGTLAIGLVIGAAAALVGGLVFVGGIVWLIVRTSRRPTAPRPGPPPTWGPPTGPPAGAPFGPPPGPPAGPPHRPGH